jgi:hypothetical protein
LQPSEKKSNPDSDAPAESREGRPLRAWVHSHLTRPTRINHLGNLQGKNNTLRSAGVVDRWGATRPWVHGRPSIRAASYASWMQRRRQADGIGRPRPPRPNKPFSSAPINQKEEWCIISQGCCRPGYTASSPAVADGRRISSSQPKVVGTALSTPHSESRRAGGLGMPLSFLHRALAPNGDLVPSALV